MIKVHTNSSSGKIVLNDFSKFDLQNKGVKHDLKCVKVYNFNTEDNLTAGMGIQKLKIYTRENINSTVLDLDYESLNQEYFNKVMYFKQYFSSTNDTTHRLLFHGSDGNLYLYQMYCNANMLNWTYKLNFTTIPIVLEYKKDGLDTILISANDKLIVWAAGRTPYELENVPTITSMCIHNDILYCTIAGESDNIWFTPSLDPEKIGPESDVSEYITLRDEYGDCKRIINFKEHLYIFRDYGISKLNIYVKNTPTYNQIYVSDSKIFANTVINCGDFIVFMTREGIYRFSGADVTKICDLPSGFICGDNEYAVATNLQEKYYVALKLNFDDEQIIGCENNIEMKNNAIIQLDLNKKSYEIMRGVDIKDMLALKAGFEEKIIATFNSTHKEKIGEITKDGKVFDEVLPKIYSSNFVTQDCMQQIVIRNIIVDASAGVKVKIITEDGQYVFDTYCNGINNFQTIISCRKFKIEIESCESECYVNLVQLEYEK